jgi:hypothetical protein
MRHALAATPRRRRRLLVCRYGGADFRGRGAVAHFLPAAVPRVPVPGWYLAGLELDAPRIPRNHSTIAGASVGRMVRAITRPLSSRTEATVVA